MVNPATGKLVRVTVSTRGLRTIKKWIEAGKKVDLAEMKNELEKI
jgi:ribosomal protein L28